MQPQPMLRCHMQQPSCTNMRNKHNTAHILYIRHLLRRRMQLHLFYTDMPVRLLKWKMQQCPMFKHDLQQPATTNMRNQQHASHILTIRHMLRRHMQLYFQQHYLPVRLLKQQMCQ